MEKKYIYGTEENKAFLKEQAESILRFGTRFLSPTGGSYYLGDDGSPWVERERETWITCRMAHVYAMGYMMKMKEAAALELTSQMAEATSFEAQKYKTEAREKLEEAASYMALSAGAIRGLRGELHDEKNGGWFAAVTSDGKSKGPKQCYAHAFVILAATSGVLAGVEGAKELLKDAEEIYDKYFWDEKLGLSVDTWNTEFTELDSYRGLNANMHTVEAFLANADATGKELYRERAGRIIDHVIDWAEANDWRIPEHYKEDWTPDLECNADKKDDPFKPYGATPGHGIEWARLITQWAVSCGKLRVEEKKFVDNSSSIEGARVDNSSSIEGVGVDNFPEEITTNNKYLNAAEHLFQRAVSDGWNADGAEGIVYTTDWNGVPVVHDRMHWTLAEAINTASVLYRVTGKEIYGQQYSAFLKYLDEKVADHETGNWFHQMDEKNQVMTTVWPGKSDLYHAEQSMLIPYQDPALSIATAIHQRG